MAADNRSLVELPQLNLEAVLLKLPLPSLLFCCCVSKSLLNLIRGDPDFARTRFANSESQLLIHSPIHTNVHLIDLDADTPPARGERIKIKPSFNLPLFGFEITHSCNGLLLLEKSDMYNGVHRSMVCNPVTGEYIMLPDSTVLMVNVTSAFIYCPVTSQFRVFRVFHRVYRSSQDFESFLNSDPDPCMECDFYSDSDSDYSESDYMGEFLQEGSDSWESIDNVPFSPFNIYSPCYLNNTAHWLCHDENAKNLIVSFNFETRQFGEISAPTHLNEVHAMLPASVNLVSRDGFLSIFDGYTNKMQLDVWKMEEYGVKDSWIREFVVDCNAWAIYGSPYVFRPAICRHNEEVVMVCESGHMVFCDLKKKRGRIVYHPPLEFAGNAVAHMPSLMSLRDVVRGSNMLVQNVSPRFAAPELNTRNYLKLCTTISLNLTGDSDN